MGNEENPVRITSANSSPRPGDFQVAIQFEGEGLQPSKLNFLHIQFAEIGLLIKTGSPEIRHAVISHNLQSGIQSSGQSAPTISYSTISDHLNNAAIIVLEQSRPVLSHNNVVNNAWGVINHSTLPFEGRENWWGTPYPNEDLFIGNVVYQPSLHTPEREGHSKDFFGTENF